MEKFDKSQGQRPGQSGQSNPGNPSREGGYQNPGKPGQGQFDKNKKPGQQSGQPGKQQHQSGQPGRSYPGSDSSRDRQ